MPRRPAATQAAIARAVRALTAHGLTVARIEVMADGAVSVIAGPPAPPPGAAAPLTPPAAGVTPAVNLDDWRARKNGHRAHQGA